MTETGYESLQQLNSQFSEKTLKQNLQREYMPYLENGKGVYIWGTGLLGRFACKQLSQPGILGGGGVIAFIDNNKKITGTVIEDIPVISPDMVETDDLIVICSQSFIEIEKQIDAELSNPKLCYHALVLLGDGLEEWGIALQDCFKKLDIYRENYKKIFLKCADEISKEILDALLAYRFTMKSAWIQKAYDKTVENGDGAEYFDSAIIELQKDEVFVDCGGYTGDTILEFMDFSKGVYKKIYYFEPSIELYNEAKDNLKNVRDVIFTPAGVGEKAGVMKFAGQDGVCIDRVSGHIDVNGTESIDVVALDEAVQDQPTFIKMDIEGAELPALKGAEKLINENKPKLAICVYHKPEDLFEILELIDSWGIDYKYYFRHYEKAIGGTILYCVPQSV